MPSKTARGLRVRVGLDGIDVVRPRECSDEETEAFLKRHEEWVGDQIERIERLRVVGVRCCNEGERCSSGERQRLSAL